MTNRTTTTRSLITLRAIQINKNWGNQSLANAYINRGNAYRSKQDYDKAIADYTQALKLKPDYANAHYSRGIAYRIRGNKQNAIDDFKKVLELTKDPEMRQRAEEELKRLGVK